MAQSQSGKWVSKVAATGGGRSYAKQRPTNFYAAIAVIVVLGVVSIFFARAEFQSNHGTTTTALSIKPAVGTTSYASLATDVCGTLQPSLPGQPTTSTSPLLVEEGGVVKIAPKTAAEAGANANVTLLATHYTGLSVTPAKLQLPANASSPSVTYTTGEACPTGTPDAGKKGRVVVSSWPSFASTTPTVTTNPSAVRFTENSLVTIAFVPEGSAVKKPSSATIQKMLIATQTAPTTATTAPVATTTPSLVPPTTALPNSSTTTTVKK